jgi:hypothetical protein
VRLVHVTGLVLRIVQIGGRVEHAFLGGRHRPRARRDRAVTERAGLSGRSPCSESQNVPELVCAQNMRPRPLSAASATCGCAASTKIRSMGPVPGGVALGPRNCTPPVEEDPQAASEEPHIDSVAGLRQRGESACTASEYLRSREEPLHRERPPGEGTQTEPPGGSSSTPSAGRHAPPRSGSAGRRSKECAAPIYSAGDRFSPAPGEPAIHRSPDAVIRWPPRCGRGP